MRIPHSDLHAHGLSLFRAIFSLVYTIFEELVQFYHAHPEHDRLRTVCLAIECMTSLFALEYTLHFDPERITPRQLLRLAKASRALTRLTGQSFDFTPWTGLTPEELDRISPIPEPSPLSIYRVYIPEIKMPPSGLSSHNLCQHPGATLANVIKKLARILPPDYSPATFIPDLSPSPEGTVPPWTVHALSPSPSQSELVSQSQSQSQSRSISYTSHPSHPSHSSHSSTVSTSFTASTPFMPSILSIPPATPDPP